MKHAYLIIAHNEFEVLRKLIGALDDSRNDIFVHFDLKLKECPSLEARNAGLFILENRVDVRWGDISVVEAEYALFKEAFQRGKKYAYYHLLSGVDLPLKSQGEIHDFFAKHAGKEFIGFSQYDYTEEVDRKVRRIHLFPRNFRFTDSFIDTAKKLIRALFLRIQFLLRIKINKNTRFKKGTQWISVTDSFVMYMLAEKREVLNTYRDTFCSDEIFVQTLCWNSIFRDRIYCLDDEAKGCMRKIGWKDGRIYDWEDGDYDELMQSGMLFARKFNGKNMQLVDKVLKNLKK
ncbi:MAG: beta-1,6-N-acetylglucosaminyltransferase [Dysgonamonadaceae bacterium]|jgi:hypothetical protein|nr:beta-1,6-N-acetylglucosaminyltransferase [Dysgonamonadaceae bacterium]